MENSLTYKDMLTIGNKVERARKRIQDMPHESLASETMAWRWFWLQWLNSGDTISKNEAKKLIGEKQLSQIKIGYKELGKRENAKIRYSKAEVLELATGIKVSELF
jgi:hypothetical protein